VERTSIHLCDDDDIVLLARIIMFGCPERHRYPNDVRSNWSNMCVCVCAARL